MCLRWMFSIVVLLIVAGCATAPEYGNQERVYLSTVNGQAVECKKVATVGSRIRNKLRCGNSVDHASVAAHEKWRREQRDARALRDGAQRTADNLQGSRR